MYKTTASIEGMACNMCESHINDTVRKNFTVKKVSSSYKKGSCEIIAEKPIEEDQLISVIKETGYTVTNVSSEPYEKKGFFSFGK